MSGLHQCPRNMYLWHGCWRNPNTDTGAIHTWTLVQSKQDNGERDPLNAYGSAWPGIATRIL
eukprot:11170338-Lingulodinium_polyedra.AAC.1